MNDQTTKLLEQLAHKMGTTVEYLWIILIKQAPIDASIDLLMCILTLIFGFLLYRLHLKFSLKNPTGETNYNNEKYFESIYEKNQEIAAIPMILAALFFGILFIICVCNINNIVVGFFNPEYWALKQILPIVKH